jgi:hypothetical protein
MRSLIDFVIFLAVVALSEGKHEESCPPTCQNPSVNITNEKLEGVWFLQYSIPFFFEQNHKCSIINITGTTDEGHLSFIKTDYGYS